MSRGYPAFQGAAVETLLLLQLQLLLLTFWIQVWKVSGLHFQT